MNAFRALYLCAGDAGWSSPVARQAHNLKVAGSNPAPATNTPLHFISVGSALKLSSAAKSPLTSISTGFRSPFGDDGHAVNELADLKEYVVPFLADRQIVQMVFQPVDDPDVGLR